MVPEVIVVPIDGRAKMEGWGEQGNQIRDWQIEEFLRQPGKAENTQRAYRGQLQQFAAWSGKASLEVKPSDVGMYRRGLKEQGLKTTSVNHTINTLKSFYGWLRRSNGFPAGQLLPTDAIDLEWGAEPQAPEGEDQGARSRHHCCAQSWVAGFGSVGSECGGLEWETSDGSEI